MSERDRVRDVYGGYAADPVRTAAWDSGNAGNRAIRRELAHVAARLVETRPPGSAILDVGCGTGWWLAHLVRAGLGGGRPAGLDILPERVAAARAAAPGADVREGDARELPWPDAAFGAVTLFTVLSSLADRAGEARALAEAVRVTAPGGVVVVWEPRWPPLRRGGRRTVARRALTAAPGATAQVRSLTLAPPLARRLGRRTDPLYSRLAHVPVLRSHRLALLRVTGPAGRST